MIGVLGSASTTPDALSPRATRPNAVCLPPESARPSTRLPTATRPSEATTTASGTSYDASVATAATPPITAPARHHVAPGRPSRVRRRARNTSGTSADGTVSSGSVTGLGSSRTTVNELSLPTSAIRARATDPATASKTSSARDPMAAGAMATRRNDAGRRR